MTKQELIFTLSEKAEITVLKAAGVVDTIFEAMSEAMRNGKRGEIRHFGTFSMRSYGAYKGRKPRTGESISVGEKRLPFFKLGKPLADKIRKNER